MNEFTSVGEQFETLIDPKLGGDLLIQLQQLLILNYPQVKINEESLCNFIFLALTVFSVHAVPHILLVSGNNRNIFRGLY